MVSYRCVGYGITNSSGVATLDHNLDGTSISGGHSYTGSGVGELDFVASVDSPTQINNGSDVSPPLSVLDCLLHDTATAQDDTKWLNYGAGATYGTDGTTLTTSTDYRYQSKYDITEDLVIEFDIKIPSTASANPSLYVKGLTPYFSAEWFPRDVWHHIIITCSNGAYNLYEDTISQATRKTGGNYSIANKIFQIRVYNNTSCTFKNFCIYPM